MEDLICYSFQVAKGMEFLASRKVRAPPQNASHCVKSTQVTRESLATGVIQLTVFFRKTKRKTGETFLLYDFIQ